MTDPKPQRVVYNTAIGGFGISLRAAAWMIEQGSEHAAIWIKCSNPVLGMSWMDSPRDCPILLAAIDRFGLEEVAGPLCKLAICEVPAGEPWEILEWDQGHEEVVAPIRYWNCQ